MSISVDLPVSDSPVMMFRPFCKSIRRTCPSAFQTAIVLMCITGANPIEQKPSSAYPKLRTSAQRTERVLRRR